FIKDLQEHFTDDENLIVSLKMQGAQIDVWGVGTKLVTAYDQPALGGVYKLTAVKDGERGEWKYRIKLSEQLAKVTTPGIHQVRRFKVDGLYAGDMIFDVRTAPATGGSIVDPFDPTRRKSFGGEVSYEDLLKPCVRSGKVVGGRDGIEKIRARRAADIKSLHAGIRRFLNPHAYPVGLEPQLYNLKYKMILDQRQLPHEEIA
ncbi:MAG: nicotinate phosphoribosyltransferase, partial [Bdellovibrionota bacterium]